MDPWIPPPPGVARATPVVPVVWQSSRVSLRSVPDGRQRVPLQWSVVVAAVVMLTATTVAVLQGGRGGLGWMITAVVINLGGYAAVWMMILPGRLRLNPRFGTAVGPDSTDVTTPTTQPIPVVGRTPEPRLRTASLLIRSAVVAMGAAAIWALLIGLWIRPHLPRVTVSVSAPEALIASLIDALVTSVLEECGMAVLILAVAGLAGRFLPSHWDTRSVGYCAILAATVARTLLHIPLWDAGAIGRIGLSFVLAWLFWRIRRVWPLIVVHVLWDALALQILISPSLETRGILALAVLGWAITGFVIACVALGHSRGLLRAEPR